MFRVYNYQGRSRDLEDPLLKLKNLITLVQGEDVVIESLNKILPRAFAVPENQEGDGSPGVVTINYKRLEKFHKKLEAYDRGMFKLFHKFLQ